MDAAVEQFDDDFPDRLYIESDYNHAAVASDLAAWRIKVQRTGLILANDYCERTDRNCGIVRAVDEPVANGDLELLGVTRDEFSSVIARRAK